jgi:hypothetical protein
MSKDTGVGWYFVVGGAEISNDIGALDQIGAPMRVIMDTGLDKSFTERLGTLHDGQIDFTAYFNTAAGRAHATLSALPRTDVQVSTLRGQVIGNVAASILGKQLDYDPTRTDAAELTAKISVQGNAFGLEWGQQLTPGFKTDTTGTNGTGLDTLASLSFGWQAYLHVTALTGTNVIVTLQDSADNVSFANLTGGAFTSATAVGAQRLAGGTTATVRRYVRAVSSGTFSSATFMVNFIKNAQAVS